VNADQIISECSFKTSRSSGAGGQHVNKTETKVSLSFKPDESMGLTEKEKERLFANTEKPREWVIRLSSQRYRSQNRNKEAVCSRLIDLLQEAIKPKKIRKPTAKPKGAEEKRLTEKKQRSEIKKLRKPPNQGE
jgi:ribosome-associated protein